MNHQNEFLVSWVPYGLIFVASLRLGVFALMFFRGSAFASLRRGKRERFGFTATPHPACSLPARTVFPKNGKQMAIMVKPVPGFAINL
jgi:hypothetical protein